jgi:hypothetical protein
VSDPIKGDPRPSGNARVPSQDVALALTGRHYEIPGYWTLELDVGERPTRLLPDGRVWRRAPIESRAREVFDAHRDILADANYRISLTGDPATIDFLEIMRATLLVSEGEQPIEILIAEEQEVIEREPAPGEEPRVIERRIAYRLLGHPDAPLPDGLVVFDLSDEGGEADGVQVPVEIPGTRVIGWAQLRNRQRLLHEAYARAAAESLIARAAHLGLKQTQGWALYCGRQAQPAVTVLRTSRGFYAGRMMPILVRRQWSGDVPGEAPSWRPLGLRLLSSSKVA